MPDSAIFSLKTDNKLLKAGLDRAKSLFKAFGKKAKEALRTTVGAFMGRLPLFGADLRTGLSAGLDALHDYEKGFSRLQAMLKATRGISGKTVDDLTKVARQVRDMSTFGVEAVQNAQSALLLFHNVRGGVFDEALKTSADWAAALGEDVVAAADRVGRALNNPIEGLKALRNEGFLFTHQQELMIEGMVMSGDIIGAQRVLLDRLKGAFGGAAKNELTTFSGMVEKTNNMLRDMWRAIANALVPVFEKLLPLIQKGSEESEEWAVWLRTLTERAVGFAEESWPAVQSFINNAMEGAKRLAAEIIKRMLETGTFVQTAFQEWPKFAEMAKDKMAITWESIRQSVKSLWEDIKFNALNVWDDMVDAMILRIIELRDKAREMLGGKLADALGIDFEKQNKETRDQLEFALALRNLQREKDRRPMGPSEEDIARLEKLRKKAEESGAAFGEKFDTNLAKNREKFDEMLAQVSDALNLDIDSGNDKNRTDPKGTKERPYIVMDPQLGKGGAFEDLLSLQRRVQSAAFKTPEVFAINAQTVTMNKLHQQQMNKLNEIATNTDKTAGNAADTASAVKQPKPGTFA